MRFAEALAELEGRKESRMVPDLARILKLATLLDDPQLTYPTIHVTGTNGKTTTARAITALACAHGITAGLYTSPHLESVTERFSVCGVDMTLEEFAAEYEHLLPFLLLVDSQSEEQVTYFEALTALAYLWFADRPVGLGVFEVGMGGTWDATNLVAGDVGVICPIALDHPELGSTIAEVATEKAGIIKEGKVAIVREQLASASAVIAERAAAVGAELKHEFEDFEVDRRLLAVGGQSLAVRGLYASYDDLFVPMFGEHAARNVAAAIAALEALLGQALSIGAVREAPRRPHLARPARGHPPPAARHPRRGAQPRRRRGAGRRDARVLHVGPAAPGAGRQRQQGPRRDDPAAGAARRRRVRRSQRQRPQRRGRGDRGAVRRRGQARRAVRQRDGGARRRDGGRRPRRLRAGDGLSVHCRGRPPGARLSR